MELLHVFSEDERRLVLEAHDEFLRTVRFVARLHRIDGSVDLAPDLSGLRRACPPVVGTLTMATTPDLADLAPGEPRNPG